MAKKIVRGITDVKTITNQDYDTNNVNDLLSDGQYNYIHRKKGNTEEYHNLTDNIKTISSDNTDLLSVTNNNKTTNTATLHPKHDAQKEQLLESTRNTITINHGTNGTAEKTTVDTNPKKVLEHTNLLTDYGISKTTSGNTTKIGLEYTLVSDGFDLNKLSNGCIRGNNMLNAPYTNTSFFVEAFSQPNFAVQIAYHMGENIPKFHRFKASGVWSEWRQQVGDKSVIDGLLAQKQDKLTAGEGITIQGNTISASGGGAPVEGATSSFEFYNQEDEVADFEVYKHTISQPFTNGVATGTLTFTRYTFDGGGPEAEIVLTGDLKNDLEKFVRANMTISNSALTITNDGTTMKLTNSAPSQNVFQQATFTFYEFIPDGGGGL